MNSSQEVIVEVPDPGTVPAVARAPGTLPDLPASAPSLPLPASAQTLPLPASASVLPLATPQLPPATFDRSLPQTLQLANSNASPSTEVPSAVAALPPPAGPTLPPAASGGAMFSRVPAMPAAPAEPVFAGVTYLPAAAPMAARGFSHSDDYQVLTGQVQSFRQIWQLRYADYSAVDKYGGSVVLEGAPLEKLQNGCQVRAQGRLVPPADRTGPARFQVQSLELIGQ